ncbi:hypothetical protein [Paenibacillus pectinilyticus]|nr:hypothetical protein [Paenibacillus pectinilyticus]
MTTDMRYTRISDIAIHVDWNAMRYTHVKSAECRVAAVIASER